MNKRFYNFIVLVFFANKMARLTGQLKTQFEENDKLEGEIKKNLAGLGYDV